MPGAMQTDKPQAVILLAAEFLTMVCNTLKSSLKRRTQSLGSCSKGRNTETNYFKTRNCIQEVVNMKKGNRVTGSYSWSSENTMK